MRPRRRSRRRGLLRRAGRRPRLPGRRLLPPGSSSRRRSSRRERSRREAAAFCFALARRGCCWVLGRTLPFLVKGVMLHCSVASGVRSEAMNHPPFDGGTPLVARALENDLAMVAQAVTVRRRSAQPTAPAGLNPATGGATGGAWPPTASQKRLRMSPSEAVDDLAMYVPGADARAAMEAMPQFSSRHLGADENLAELRPEGMVNTYEVREPPALSVAHLT